MRTEWDLERFAESAKNTKVRESGQSPADERLSLRFPQAEFGRLVDPSTILDRHGRVAVWALPGVLHPKRLVKIFI